MKSLISLVGVLMFLVGTLGIASVAHAESAVVATTNIYNAKIVSQDNNTFTISFDLSNRVGAQGQVRYGVYLMQGTSTTSIAPIIFDEILSLPEGDIIERKIEYQAPGYLTPGEYQLIIEVMTTEGLVLAQRNAGSVVVEQTKNVPSLQVRCERNNTATVLSDSDSNNPLQVECTFVSDREVKLIPQFTTYKNTRYGIQFDPTAGMEISVTDGTTTQTLSAPVVTIPGAYELVITFAEPTSSTKYDAGSVYYKTQGPYAVVTNAVFDKDSYRAGESAILSVLWAESRREPSAKTLSVTVSGALGECAPPQTTILEANNAVLSISVPLSADCDDPTATFMLYDDTNTVIGTSVFGVVSRQSEADNVDEQMSSEKVGKSSSVKLLLIVLGLLMVFLVILLIKHRSRPNVLVITFIVFSAFSFAQEARADTVMVRGWPFLIWVDNPVIHVPGYFSSEDPDDYDWINYVEADPHTRVSNSYNGDYITEVFPMIEGVKMGLIFTNGAFEQEGPGNHFYDASPCSAGSNITHTNNWGASVHSVVPPVSGTYSVTFRNAIRDYITDRWRPICNPVGSGGTTVNSPPDWVDTVMEYKIVKDGECDYPGLMCHLSFYCPSSYIANQSGGCIYGTKINAAETATSFTWQCTGSANGGDTKSCVVRKPDAACGSAHGGTFATAPSSNLCSKGVPTAVNDGTYWGWDCEGTYFRESCGANKDAGTSIDGGWSSWSACSGDCGGGSGVQTRTCTNPAPANGGADCAGSDTQACTNNASCSCTPTNAACAASTCTTNTCWDGCNNIPGTMICGVGASCTANNLTRTWSTNCNAIQNGTWADGDTATVNDNDASVNGYTGSVQYTCNNGAWSSPFNQSCNIVVSPNSRLIVCSATDIYTIATSEKLQLSARYWPNYGVGTPNCSTPGYTDVTASTQWISSSPGIASVGDNVGDKGLVTGNSGGLAQIRAHYGVSVFRTVTVSGVAKPDLVATNNNPGGGMIYTNPSSITFTGGASNLAGATPVGVNFWADVEIDWNQPNCAFATPETSKNAGGPWNSVPSSWDVSTLSATLFAPNSELRNGLQHCWRMIIDRADIIDEVDDLNNGAPWRAFAISGLPQCSDGIDNDGDTLIDHPADPGCSSPVDNSEINMPVASGDITATDCTIKTGEGTCQSSVTWNNVVGVGPGNLSVRQSGVGEISTVFSGNNVPRPIGEGITLFSLYNKGTNPASLLDAVSVEAKCDTVNATYNNVTGLCEANLKPTITANPQVVKQTNPASLSEISWTVGGYDIVANPSICTVSGPGINVPVTALKQSVEISSRSTYTITCGNAPPVSASVTVEVRPTVIET